MTPPSTLDLARLGDDLERATARSLAASRHRARVRLAGLGLVALTVLATGTAMAAGLFSPKQVAGGMPAGSVIFGNASPICVLDADGLTYHCTLDVAPQSDTTGLPPVTRPDHGIKPAGPTIAPDYMGWAEPIGIDGVVTGGCRGRSSDGMKWDCYIGSEAVKQMIISQDFLGQPMTEPGRG